MDPIFYINRTSCQQCEECVYGAAFLHFLYGDSWGSKFFGTSLAYFLARIPMISAFYGWLQKTRFSQKKIAPFIKHFSVDVKEFAQDPSTFASFNDFFIRKLKASARPIATQSNVACIPADGRYLFYQRLDQVRDFIVKGKTFDLEGLLKDKKLAEKYSKGAMVLARLCPSDYHRFHFPCDCIPGETRYINGWLYSVNPIAIKKNIQILSENKRTLCTLQGSKFGEILFLEIGATMVGAIHQTYTPFQPVKKGDEKGYFSFGGSSLILLFPPHSIQFDQDLLDATAQGLETLCLMGQSMGVAKS